MDMNIKAIRGKGSSCFQDLIITVSENWKMNYELFFSQSINFNFNFQKEKSLGECIYAKRITSNEIAEKYHGICIEKIKFNSSSESLGELIKLLNNEELAAIYLDSFYTPWHPHGSYGKLHGNHRCLVINYDSKKCELHCIDPVFSNKIEILDVENFLKGNNGELAIFRKKVPIKITDSEIKLIINQIKETYIKENKIQDILVLANKFLTNFDMDKEINGEKNFWNTNIWRKLDVLIFGRYYFYKFIKFFSNYCIEFKVIENDALSSYRKWEMIRSIITKMFYLRNSEEKHINNIYNFLLEIYLFEERIRNFLMNVNYKMFTTDKVILEKIKFDLDRSKLNRIKLEDFNNNKAFLIEKKLNNNNKIVPDFNGEGRYIYLTHKDEDKFEISSFGYDNVKCEGQLINVPRRYYNYLILYGCSEFGGCHSKIKLYYEKQIIDQEIFFSDWGDEEELENNLFHYWSGKSDEGYDKFIKELIIPINHYEKLKSIELPFYPNLHIFSIKLNEVYDINNE